MITFAKGVTSGYLPLGGVIAAGHVAAPFFAAPGPPVLRHGATYAGHPTCCAAALAVLDIYEAEDVIGRGQELEGPLQDALAPLAAHPAVGEVRAGHRACSRPWPCRRTRWRPTPPPRPRSRRARARRGCWCARCCSSVAVSPPLIVEQEHLEQLADGFRAGLERVA